jgi:transposase
LLPPFFNFTERWHPFFSADLMPLLANETITELYERMLKLDGKAVEDARKISRLAGQSEVARRLMQIEGIGPITATALLASVGDGKLFRNGREFAA